MNNKHSLRSNELKPYQKISDTIWEIPTSYKKGMRVPARIVATEKLINMMEPEVFEQITNVATLPGLVKYVICMPDGHVGYGCPIGGVGATDPENGGVISPGMIGFDINCLSTDTKILTEFGYFMPIAAFEKERNRKILCFDRKSRTISETKPLLFLKKRVNPKVIEIKTEGGFTLKGTPEHPILTPFGMIELSRIQVKERVAVSSFIGVEFEEPRGEAILDQKDILQSNIPWNRRQIIKELTKRELLPLKYNSPKLPYLIKVMSYNLGDGSLLIVGKGEDAAVWFWGKKKDLERIRKDIKKLGYRPSKVYVRKRHHKIKTRYGRVIFDNIEYSFKLGSKSFATLLHATGIPFGAKARQNYTVPSWLLKAPLWQKRLFLASYFGAEMTAPATMTGHGFNFYMPTVSVNKTKETLTSGKKFLRGITKMLEEFGIRCANVSEVDMYKGKHGKTIRLRLQVNGEIKNVLRFFETVGFEYAQEKRFLSAAASLYLRLKERILAKREEASITSKNLYKGRGNLQEVVSQFDSHFVNKRFIERSIFEGRKTGVRTPSNFPTFSTFLKSNALGKDGFFWDRVESIKGVPFSDWVYDFTVDHKSHNFIANNLVVSNCGMRLLTTTLSQNEVGPRIKKLIDELFVRIPAGVGSSGFLKLSKKEFEEIIVKGAGWAVEKGFGKPEDLGHIEEKGCLSFANPDKISRKAIERSLRQIGTLGSGNHYLEIQIVENIFDKERAKAWGITSKNQVVVMFHCGSRGFGHQVATDYLQIFEKNMVKYNITVPDRQLACAPFVSSDGQNYFQAMAGACNLAFANRQVITHKVREVLGDLPVVYDVAHNIAKIEEYPSTSSGFQPEASAERQVKKLVVHRKGATRAYPGQPVILGGSMQTGSYLLVGTQKAMEEAFGSTAHGSGRTMSRASAKKRIHGQDLALEMQKKGIYVRSVSFAGLAEEAGFAYKNIHEVVEALQLSNLSLPVASFKPIGNIKG